MGAVAGIIDLVLGVVRPVLFAGAAGLGVVAILDWLVRTRRISPFSPLARFSRDTMSPLFKPVEHRIVKAGGNPQSAPWWTLALAVIGGIVFLSLLEFLRDQLLMGMSAAQGGMRGVTFLLVRWTMQILRLALMVRVISSWIQVSPYSRWVRWAFTLSEPILRPLRQVIPALGMVDITPIVAFFGLSLLEGLLLGMLR